jgi:hypothetical protein
MTDNQLRVGEGVPNGGEYRAGHRNATLAPPPQPKLNAEVKIIQIILDDTESGIQKTRDGYSFKIHYLLEDGTTVSSTQTERLLRDAKKEMASLPKAPNYPTKVIYYNGEFFGLETTFSIGGSDYR